MHEQLLPLHAGLLCLLSDYHSAAGQSMKQHLLSSYFHAVLSVALAQFGSSGFPCGMPGIIRLAESSPYVQASCNIPPAVLRLCARELS